MKKILIWDNFPLQNAGGQSGYLYNIHEYLKENPSDQITFLSDLLGCKFSWIDSSVNVQIKTTLPVEVKEYEKEDTKGWRDFIHQLPPYLKFWRIGIFVHYQIQNLLYKIRKSYEFSWGQFRRTKRIMPNSIDLNQFDFIHFHFNPTAAQFKAAYPEYKGKIILTSHCPCPWTVEHVTYHEPWMKRVSSIALYSECRTYKLVDYLMFPCQGAREAYEKEPKIKKIFRANEHKFFYVPTSIMDFKVDVNKMQKFADLGIPDNAFVITYFGRHISIKGYDILKDIGRRLLDRYENLYFLCAGRGDIEPLDHPRWKELGFISNANELLYQSDLYILPNRETYFDMITLEIMRSGTNLLLADNGGNTYFRTLPQKEITGLSFFDVSNLEQMIELTEQAINESKENPEKYREKGQANRTLYEKYFTPEKYIEKYLYEINNLN